MADLTTLDPTLPPDTEVASLGASRIRDTRAAILGSFGAPADNGFGGTQAEHHLNGPHAIPSGNIGFEPAAGNLGRLFLALLGNGQRIIRYDNGSSWISLAASGIEAYITGFSGTLVNGAPTTIATTSYTLFRSTNIFVVVGCTCSYAASGATFTLNTSGATDLVIGTQGSRSQIETVSMIAFQPVTSGIHVTNLVGTGLGGGPVISNGFFGVFPL